MRNRICVANVQSDLDVLVRRLNLADPWTWSLPGGDEPGTFRGIPVTKNGEFLGPVIFWLDSMEFEVFMPKHYAYTKWVTVFCRMTETTVGSRKFRPLAEGLLECLTDMYIGGWLQSGGTSCL